MVVGIGPFGVESEYRCQPGSILAVSLASTRAPGGAAEGSSARDHFTGSGRCARTGKAKRRATKTQPAVRWRRTSVRLRDSQAIGRPALQLLLDAVIDLATRELRRHPD